ncbi:alpha/beta hydrolase [Pseudonocardia sp. N23]|nr:alpha/beta hydrolase [Pseudonocardia sp. N23]
MHGNPETAAIWGPLVDHLGDDDPVVRLSPPGFGAPVPDGFAATWEAYRDWLVAELGAAPVVQRGQGLAAQGMDAGVADKVAAAFDPAMGECILRLYRSAAQPAMADLGGGLEAAAQVPGLALVPTEDPYVGTSEQKARAAARAGARVEELDGLGHWWMMQDPARGAAALTRFWSGL